MNNTNINNTTPIGRLKRYQKVNETQVRIFFTAWLNEGLSVDLAAKQAGITKSTDHRTFKKAAEKYAVLTPAKPRGRTAPARLLDVHTEVIFAFLED